jgi:hypothetical protein
VKNVGLNKICCNLILIKVNIFSMIINIPIKYTQLVGTKKEFTGMIFSRKVLLPPTVFDVLEIRRGMATMKNI